MADLNHDRMELFPPGDCGLEKMGSQQKVLKCFSTLSLVNFSTDKIPQTSSKQKPQTYPKEP